MSTKQPKAANKYMRTLWGSLSALIITASPLFVAWPAHAVTFSNDYPDMDAANCSGQFGSWSWCKEENGTPGFQEGEQRSPRLFWYRNCTDGAAYWVKKYTGVTVPSSWGNAHNWDNAATAYTVKPGNANNIEPGDIAQSDTAASGTGHVGFVTEVVKDANGVVTSIKVAELNHSGNGEYNDIDVYSARHANGKFKLYTSDAWDHFIDVNGANRGLNNESLGGASMAGSSNLTFIKTSGVNNVEVHWVNKSNNFSTWAGGVSTWFSSANANHGTFTMADMNGDNIDDLVFIKTANTSNGKVELHWLDGANNFAGVPQSRSTWFSASDASNGKFSIAKMDGDSLGDLVFIKTTNVSNVEVHWVGSTNNYSQWTGGFSTWFSASNVPKGEYSMADMNDDGLQDLVYIKTSSTGTGKVEYHWASRANNYATWAGGGGTWFSLADVQNGTFSMAKMDDSLGLVFVKVANTSSGHIEIHWANSATSYQQWSGGASTWFNVVDASNGRFVPSRH